MIWLRTIIKSNNMMQAFYFNWFSLSHTFDCNPLFPRLINSVSYTRNQSYITKYQCIKYTLIIYRIGLYLPKDKEPFYSWRWINLSPCPIPFLLLPSSRITLALYLIPPGTNFSRVNFEDRNMCIKKFEYNPTKAFYKIKIKRGIFEQKNQPRICAQRNK